MSSKPKVEQLRLEEYPPPKPTIAMLDAPHLDHVEIELQEKPISSPRSPSSPRIEVKQVKPVRKRKKRIFRSLGFSKLNSPITFISFIGSLIFVIGSIVKSVMYPSLSYCHNEQECIEQPAGLSFSMDLLIMIIGCSISLVFIVMAVLILMCPGALMDYPVRNKVLSFVTIFFSIWTCVLLASPVVLGR